MEPTLGYFWQMWAFPHSLATSYHKNLVCPNFATSLAKHSLANLAQNSLYNLFWKLDILSGALVTPWMKGSLAAGMTIFHKQDSVFAVWSAWCSQKSS